MLIFSPNKSVRRGWIPSERHVIINLSCWKSTPAHLSRESSDVLWIRSIKHHSVQGCVILRASFHGLMLFWYNLGTGPVNSGQLLGKQSLVHTNGAQLQSSYLTRALLDGWIGNFQMPEKGCCWGAMLKGPCVHVQPPWAQLSWVAITIKEVKVCVKCPIRLCILDDGTEASLEV